MNFVNLFFKDLENSFDATSTDNIENNYFMWSESIELHHSNTLNLALFLYTYNFYLFMLVGLILLVSMIGSIALVLTRNQIFAQPIYKQVLRKPSIT